MKSNILVSLAWPIADQALTQEILDLVQQASHYHQLRKGANEGNCPIWQDSLPLAPQYLSHIFLHQISHLSPKEKLMHTISYIYIY